MLKHYIIVKQFQGTHTHHKLFLACYDHVKRNNISKVTYCSHFKLYFNCKLNLGNNLDCVAELAHPSLLLQNCVITSGRINTWHFTEKQIFPLGEKQELSIKSQWKSITLVKRATSA